MATLTVMKGPNGAESDPKSRRNGRVFRAYDVNYNMIDAVVANGGAPESVIAKLFEDPATAFVQARSVSRGCYTFAVERI